MKIDEKIQTDIAIAMKDREEHRLTTLQMMKLTLRVKVIEKREELTDAEETQILTTLIKQRGSWWRRLRRAADRSWRRRSGWRSKYWGRDCCRAYNCFVRWVPSISDILTRVNRPLISVVDDDESVRESIEDIMRSVGFAVKAFASAGEFLSSHRVSDTDIGCADAGDGWDGTPPSLAGESS
jgi:hypothetical protein